MAKFTLSHSTFPGHTHPIFHSNITMCQVCVMRATIQHLLLVCPAVKHGCPAAGLAEPSFPLRSTVGLQSISCWFSSSIYSADLCCLRDSDCLLWSNRKRAWQLQTHVEKLSGGPEFICPYITHRCGCKQALFKTPEPVQPVCVLASNIYNCHYAV